MDLEIYLWYLLLGLSLEGYFIYNIDIFDRVIIIGMMEYFLILLKVIVVNF